MVSVSVISLGLRLRLWARLITLISTLIIPDITKTELEYVIVESREVELESRVICRESDKGKSEVRHKTYSTFTIYLKITLGK